MERKPEREKWRDVILDNIIDTLIQNHPVSITQTCYKQDFFKIFKAAYQEGFCGYTWRNDLETGRVVQRPNQLSPITGDAIVDHAKERGFVDSEMGGKPKNVEDLTLLRTWWDEWIFAWGRHPENVKSIKIGTFAEQILERKRASGFS